VLLLSETGDNIGVVSIQEALRYAVDKNLDLIEVSAGSNPPVCRVMDLGKYLYKLEKKERGQRKGAKVGKLKNVRISLRISQHDAETKITQTKNFLEKGYKVRIEIFLRGRERMLIHLAREKLEKFYNDISEQVQIKKEGEIKKNPRGMEVIIAKK
jgi:translation initiation factor IF-3